MPSGYYVRTPEYKEKMRQVALACGYGKWFRGMKKPWVAIRNSKYTGEKNNKWKGDAVGYRGIHRWINNHKKKSGTCKNCFKECRTVWANLSHEYKRDLSDWAELCQSCNMQYDRGHIERKPSWE